MEIKLFFPTGILFHQVSNKLANKIESLIVPRLNNLECLDSVNTDFKLDNKIISKKEMSDLIKEVRKCSEYYAEKVKVSVKGIKEYWVQDYLKNQFHGTHNHGRSLFSVVYWVRASNSPGDLIIYESSPFKKVWFQRPSEYPFSYSSTRITPKKGMLVLFPGYLDHEVLPGNENCIRTTIAFNIM